MKLVPVEEWDAQQAEARRRSGSAPGGTLRLIPVEQWDAANAAPQSVPRNEVNPGFEDSLARLDALDSQPDAQPPADLADEQVGLVDHIDQFLYQTGVGPLASGVNKGVLANLAGAPVDMISGAMRMAGYDPGPAPFLGSEHLRNTLVSVGAAMEPESARDKFLDRMGQELGATAGPMGLAGAGLRALNSGRQVTTPIVRELTEEAATKPGRFIANETATAAAGGAGAATAQQIAPDSAVAEITGQLAPSAALATGSAAVRGLARGGEAGRRQMQQNLQDFETAGVEPSVGQASGTTLTQAAENVLGRAPGGVGQVMRKAERQSDQMRGTAEGIGSDLGAINGAERAGLAVQRGLFGPDGFVDRFQTKAGTLFDELDSHVPPNSAVQVGNTRAALADLSAPIEGAAALSGTLANPKILQIRQSLEQDISENGTLPYEALKQLRSRVGNLLTSSEIISEAPRAQLKQLYGALTDDLAQAAADTGPEAVKTFNRANDFYRAGMDRIDTRLARINRKADPESVFRAVTQGREGASTIRAIKRSVSDEDWNVVAGAVLKRLGRATPGNQDELGEAFSASTFLTNWNRLAPEARQEMFSGTPELEGYSKAIDSLAATAARIRESSQVLANPSGTTAQAANLLTLGGAVGGAASGSLEIPITLGLLATGSAAATKLMMSPNFARWLARATQIPPQRLPNHISRLLAQAEDWGLGAEAREFLDATAGVAESAQADQLNQK